MDFASSFRKVATDAALELASQDAVLAGATLARGLRQQTREGKICAVLQLVAVLAEGERPGFRTAVIKDLAERPDIAERPAQDAVLVSDGRPAYRRRRRQMP